MKEQIIFFSIIFGLIGVIVYLASVLLMPELPEPPMTFERLMNITSDLRDSLSEVSITYLVNVTTTNDTIIGEMNFHKDESGIRVTLSDSIRPYEDYGILLGPEQLIRFIQRNDRQEYSGELINDNISDLCWSTITQPTGTQYNKFIDGDYLFVTCFNKEIGYPTIGYSSESTDDEVIVTEFYITNYTFTLNA